MAGDLEAVQKLIDNPPADFLEISNKINEANLFRILGISYNELVHSNFLVFMMDAKERHNLGNIFLNKFLSACGVTVKEGEYKINREYSFEVTKNGSRRIDILLINEEEKSVICIENKVHSFESRGQLKAYENFLNETFKENGYSVTLFYLSPTNEEINTENWIRISYEPVLKAAEECCEVCEVEEIKKYIEEYKSIVRRDVMDEDEELKQLCKKAYKENKDVIDTIIAYTRHPLSPIINKVVKEEADKMKSTGYQITILKAGKTEVIFTTTGLEKFFPSDKIKKSKYLNSGHRVVYDIVIEPKRILFTAMITELSHDNEAIRSKIFSVNNDKPEGEYSRTKIGEQIKITDADDFEIKLEQRVKDFIEQNIPTYENKLNK